jgi:hypothetical protein
VPAGLPQYNADLRDSADRTGDAALTSVPVKALALAQSYANANCGGALSACSPITLTSWRADSPDTLAMLLSRLQTGGAQNLGVVRVPDVDTLLDQAATISSGSGDVPLDQISRAEQLYVTNVAWIPLAQGTFAQVMHSDVSNLTYSADQHISLATWQRAYLKGAAVAVD